MLVSVVCLAYNHEKYIHDALVGFRQQKTNFPVRFIIVDDCSTDRTVEIIKTHGFEVIVHSENWGPRTTLYNILPGINSKYVAYCDGDDYWTNPLKLQMQVDYMESHPDCTLCFHPVTMHWECGTNEDEVIPNPVRFPFEYKDIHNLFKINYVQINSVMYRWKFWDEFESVFEGDYMPGDWLLHLLHAEKGEMGYIPHNMAVYRRHKGSLWYDNGKEFWLKMGLKHLRMFKKLDERFGDRFRPDYEPLLATTCLKALDAAVHYKNEGLVMDIMAMGYTGLIKKHFRGFVDEWEKQRRDPIVSTNK